MRNVLVAVMVLTVCLAAAAQGGPNVATEVRLERDAVAPGNEARGVAVTTMADSWHVNAHEPLEDFLIPTTLDLETPEGITLRGIMYPEHELVELAFSDEPVAVYESGFVIGFMLETDVALPAGEYQITARLNFQACNDTQCSVPDSITQRLSLRIDEAAQTGAPGSDPAFDQVNWSAISSRPGERAASAAEEPAAVSDDRSWRELAARFDVVRRETGYRDADDFLAFLSGEESAGLFEGKSIWLVLLLTVLGGLALNLTPCVLPLIPINIAIIGAGAQAGSKTRGFFMGLAYGTGIALVYGGAGAVVVVTAGTFGAINASPWFNLSIAALFVFLGLAMFDVVTIDFTKYRSKIGVKRNEQGSFLVALFLGGVAALLAGACVAPVIIAVILFARNLYAQGAWAGLLLPFLLGVGMALPWPFAGAGLSFLPKPGKWMNRVKYVFGVFILGLAAYYAFLGYGLLQQRNLDSAHAPVDGAVSVAAEEGWHTSLAQGLQEALDENRPVLVDFWATWCKSCLTMDRTTFKEPRVIGALEDFVAVKYQAEDPKAGPTAAVLDHFGVVGLPTYVILEPKTGAK